MLSFFPIFSFSEVQSFYRLIVFFHGCIYVRKTDIGLFQIGRTSDNLLEIFYCLFPVTPQIIRFCFLKGFFKLFRFSFLLSRYPASDPGLDIKEKTDDDGYDNAENKGKNDKTCHRHLDLAERPHNRTSPSQDSGRKARDNCQKIPRKSRMNILSFI